MCLELRIMSTSLWIVLLTSLLAVTVCGDSCPFDNCRVCTAETVVCHGNKVCPKDLPATVLTLSLSGAYECGSNIEQGLVENLVNLRSLFLTNTIYGTVSNNSFLLNPNLENIILSNNDILTVNEGAFNGLDKVADINLLGNELTELDKNVFNHLSTLRTLNLNFNKLTNITKGLFSGLKFMNTLFLSDNLINVVEPGAFEGSKISYLSLANNPITHFEPDIFMNSKIGILDLKGTRLTSLPDDILVSVETLFLSGLTNWTCDCTTLPLLEHLKDHQPTFYPVCQEAALVGGKSLGDVGDLLRGLCHVTPTPVESTTTVMDTTTVLMNATTTVESTTTVMDTTTVLMNATTTGLMNTTTNAAGTIQIKLFSPVVQLLVYTNVAFLTRSMLPQF